jgi:hypothetical protein
MKTIKITADGTVEQVEINGYDELKGHLDGGYLEGLHLTDDASAFIDEEGKIKGLPFNAVATELCSRLQVGLASTDFISGTMLVVGAPDEDGESTDCPDHGFAEILDSITG